VNLLRSWPDFFGYSAARLVQRCRTFESLRLAAAFKRAYWNRMRLQAGSDFWLYLLCP
jgi:hypothetical protein